MLDSHVIEKAAEVIATCQKAGLMVATVESCTGGLVSAALTAVPGSSAVVDRGFVTYTNEAKTELVGVPAELIARVGAVSAEVAAAMATGGLAHSNAQIAVSLTGIAGPGGGTDTKPVGLVHFGCARTGRKVVLHHEIFAGDRTAIRQAAVLRALEMILRAAA